MLSYRLLRLVVRRLFRRKLYTFVAMATLAVGIGLNTAVFSILDAVVLQPLNYPDSDRLVLLHRTSKKYRESKSAYLRSMWDRVPLTYSEYLELRESPILAAIGLFQPWNAVYTGGDEPLRLKGMAISPGLLEALGVEPLAGRGFLDEDAQGAQQLVLVSHGFWQQHLGRASSAIGRTLRLDDEPFEVVGIMPAGFTAGAEDQQIWKLLAPEDSGFAGSREARFYQAVARLSPGISVEEARHRFDGIAERLAAADSRYADLGLRLEPLQDSVVGDSRRLLYLIFAVSAVVLLIACTNIANLMLAEWRSRRGEIAVRMSLGAARLHILGQALAESLVLAVLGISGGLLLANWAGRTVTVNLPLQLPRAEDIALNERALAFAIVSGVLASLLAALAPALYYAASNPAESLKSASARTGGRHSAARFSAVAEIAIAFPLLAAAGLLANSFMRLTSVDPGLQPQQVLTQPVSLNDEQYPDPQKVEFYARLIETVNALPEIEAAAATSLLPFSQQSYTVGVHPPGRQEDSQSSLLEQISPRYFEVLSIPLMQGRAFEPADTRERGRVAIVNQTLMQHFWPQGNPLGRSLSVAGSPPYSVIGVAQDVRHKGLETRPGPKIYLPFQQVPSGYMTLVIRTPSRFETVSKAVRSQIWALDRNLPLAPAARLEQVIADSVGLPKTRAVLVGLLAGLACLLALVGVYGLTAVSVNSRRREMGIRLALGARRAQVHSMVLGETFRLALLGIALGAALALAGSRLLSGLLFEVKPTDPATLAAVGALMVLTALLAGLLPALRASRTDPLSVLRVE